MSEDKRHAAPDADDLAKAPFIDDEEPAEAAWLLAREGNPGAPAPSPAIAREYAELEGLLGDLPSPASDQSWQDEVLKLASSSGPSPQRVQRRRIYRWAVAGTLVAAAAVAVLVLRSDPRPSAGELEYEIRHGDSVRGDSQEAAVGDRLVIRAHPRGPGDLRVFRADGSLVARCPAGPGCTILDHGEHSIDIKLDAPTQYYVILAVGMTGDLPGGTMDAYLDAAGAANARIVSLPAIEVH